eukprot:jgi/Ulvmu1/6719/UM030_0052.1
MPSSHYGHSTRGHNLQNLRDVGGTAVKKLAGGFRAQNDWQREVDDIIRTYKNDNHASSLMREDANANMVSGKRHLSKSVNSTESALASKIRKTQEAKARLEKTILDVDLEIQNLTKVSAKLSKLLGRRKASLHTAEKRMQIRSLRPNRELTNDTVQLNLINQTDLLHQFIFRIERGLQAVNHNISRLQDARSALHADAKDKEEAIRIDRGALAADAASAAAAGTATAPNLEVPLKHPHMWAQATNGAITAATSLVDDSRSLRRALTKVVAEQNDGTVQMSSKLEQSMQDRIADTRRNRKALEDQLEQLRDEAARAKRQRNAVRDAAKARHGPELLAVHRSKLRQHRPGREQIIDEAEHALAKEMRVLQIHNNDLDAQGTALDTQIAKLESARQQVEAHLHDKGTGENVDVECAMLDGRNNLDRPINDECSDISSMYSFRPSTSASRPRLADFKLPAGTTVVTQPVTRPSTAPETGSSAAARHRIERLEAELASAREERVAMQESVDELAKEMA